MDRIRGTKRKKGKLNINEKRMVLKVVWFVYHGISNPEIHYKKERAQKNRCDEKGTYENSKGE
jgi:hypothetical protein